MWEEAKRRFLIGRYEAVPITDPAIQAALDDLNRQEEPFVVPEILREHARMVSRKSKRKSARAGALGARA